MKINITPYKQNQHPTLGVLIRGKTVAQWLHDLKLLDIDLKNTKIYPVASKKANELYGCFFIVNKFHVKYKSINTVLFQAIHNHIFIPEFSKINPRLNYQECHNIFKEPHVYHPEFEWVALSEAIVWETLLNVNILKEIKITKPAKTIPQPRLIKSYQLIAEEEFDVIKALGLKPPKPVKDTLNGIDKAKLKLFKTLFSTKKNNKGGFDVKPKGLFKWLDSFKGESRSNKPSKWEKDLEKLLFRNQKETDKLLDLFKSNPSLALKLALPLDLLGTSRDSGNGLWKLFKPQQKGTDSAFTAFISKILVLFFIFGVIYLVFKLIVGIANTNLWPFIYSLLTIAGIIIGTMVFLAIFDLIMEKSDGSGNDATIDSERMEALRKQYEKIAKNEIDKKDYKKAANIYIRLLKDYNKAAEVLEKGKLYQEAAAIHLKYNKNKLMAALSYEKGKFYEKSIALNKELKNHEKVGDLYKMLGNNIEANSFFQIVIDDYLKNSQYVKASLIYKYKIEDKKKAQYILLKGWRDKNDASNCLTNYFSNFKTSKTVKRAIENIYTNETNSDNITIFLKALKIEFKNHEDLQEYIQSIAYEIVANNLNENSGITYELNAFNNNNSLLNSDTTKFVKSIKKRRNNK